MSRPVHEFRRQKEREEICREIRVAFYQSRGLVRSIEHVSVPFEKLAGLDKVMWLHSGMRHTYEDKTDFRAAQTTNLFLETWSKKPTPSQAGVRGWGYTCGAQYIDFFLPQHRTVLIGETLKLKALVRKWDTERAYPTKEAVNETYCTVGLVVPVAVVVKEAELKAMEIGEDVIRQGIALHAQKCASEYLGRVIDDAAAVAAVTEFAIQAHATIGEPCGRLNGVKYSTPAEFAAILASRTHLEIVRDKLLKDGEISEEWFSRHHVGARLPPEIAKLRAAGWSIDNDKDERIYRLVKAGDLPPEADDLPLFPSGKAA